jgi:predicted nucleic acid-binding protein
MKIVVDTNIIFRSLLNTKNTIGDIFLDSKNQFEFFSTNYMRIVITRHWDKLKKISGLSDNDLQVSYLRLV